MSESWFHTLRGTASNVEYAKENAYITSISFSVGDTEVLIPGQTRSATLVKEHDHVVVAGRMDRLNKGSFKGLAYALNKQDTVHGVNELWHMSNAIVCSLVAVLWWWAKDEGWGVLAICILGATYYGMSSLESFLAKLFLRRAMNEP